MNTPSEVSGYSNSGKGLQGLEHYWKSPAFAGLYLLVCESSHRWPSSWESCVITTSRRSPGDGGLGGGVVCGCAGRSLPGSPVTTGNEWAYLNPTRCLDLGWNPITSPISKEVPQTPKNWQCAHSLFASTPCDHTKYTRPPNRGNSNNHSIPLHAVQELPHIGTRHSFAMDRDTFSYEECASAQGVVHLRCPTEFHRVP